MQSREILPAAEMSDLSLSTSSLQELNLLESPLARHKITLMRSKKTLPAEFRRLVAELSLLVGVEAAKDLRLEQIEEVSFTLSCVYYAES